MSAYLAANDRYERIDYRRCGNSGVHLPVISLGLWNNFGHDRPMDSIKEMLFRAFDLGITHFDLANNYGPPAGSAEENFGRVLSHDLKPYRDELIISTKAGYRMWPGPYGDLGSRKYLLASLDQSLLRMKVDYVDIFYSHRFDPDTPLEETVSALETAVLQGKALYVGISSYSARKTAEAAELLRSRGIRCLIHQPSYSMLNRWIESELLDELARQEMGCIAFSPLAQGLLSTKYIDAVPEDSRVRKAPQFFSDADLTEDRLRKVEGLAEIARERGQTLPQMAIAWVLRDTRVTSALIGASRVSQIDENVAASRQVEFTDEELKRIDQFATESGINKWAQSSEVG